jgi:hypothetical protein
MAQLRAELETLVERKGECAGQLAALKQARPLLHVAAVLVVLPV